MPYIKKHQKEYYDVVFPKIETCGDLNYLLTKLCIKYMDDHGLSYQVCNDIVGALDNAKDEFRRRIQHRYESEKIKDNGDVYDIEKYFGDNVRR